MRTDPQRGSSIPVVRSGETVGPFEIHIPWEAIVASRWRAGLTWWERLLDRGPLRGWVMRRNLGLAEDILRSVGQWPR